MTGPFDPIQLVEFVSWRQFKSELFERLFSANSSANGERPKLLFRGQSCNSWHLLSSFDRLMEEHGIRGGRIEEVYTRSLEDFYINGVEMNLIAGLTRVSGQEPFPAIKADPEKMTELEAYAQHYGFPTRLLDWSESPYVAAFFAASDHEKCTSKQLTIWCLNVAVARQILNEHDLVIRERTLDRERRQVWQRASFTINRTNHTKTDEIFDPTKGRLRDEPASPALYRCTIPQTEAVAMLTDLDFMRINYLSVFPDIDGLVRYANYKMRRRIK